MIKNYCIVYNEIETTEIENRMYTYSVTTETKEIYVPGLNLVDAVNYASKNLEIENISGVYEL